MIWITTLIAVAQGFAPIVQTIEFPDQQSCEAKRIEMAVDMPALKTTICTLKPAPVVIRAPRHAKR